MAKAYARCFACGSGVHPGYGVRIKDYSVKTPSGLPITRHAHKGECGDRVKMLVLSPTERVN